MRTDRLIAALLLACAAAGCAGVPAQREASAPAPATPSLACAALDATSPDGCALPADVRAFVEDRALCDHFRGEPWPESDSEEDRRRRRELVDGVRMHCAGIDRRLVDLKRLHGADARIAGLLARYEERVGD